MASAEQDTSSKEAPIDTDASKVDPYKALSECLFSQYMMTVAGVASGTTYALYKKPKNGLAFMLVAGAAGTMTDLAYGWTTACRPQVRAWQQAQLLQQQQEEEKLKRSKDF